MPRTGSYGLLAWLGVYAALGLLPATPWFGISAIALALLLASLGLVSSTLHLGRKERAWRAFSQWRSSWLSREGVAAVLTYPIAIAFAAAVYRDPSAGVAVRLLGLIAAAAALVTVFCTSMICASLKRIRHWHNAHTAPDYLIHAVFSGAVLLALLNAAVFGTAGAAAAVSVAAAAVARRHAVKLRRISLTVGFAAPLGLSLLASLSLLPLATTAAALACAASGLLTERWLFFAEATHVSALYYGRKI